MSAELDKRIDALRDRLIKTANTPISMGNYKQQLRAYQEMMLELINILDTVNATDEHVSPSHLSALKKLIEEKFGKPVGEK